MSLQSISRQQNVSYIYIPDITPTPTSKFHKTIRCLFKKYHETEYDYTKRSALKTLKLLKRAKRTFQLYWVPSTR